MSIFPQNAASSVLFNRFIRVLQIRVNVLRYTSYHSDDDDDIYIDVYVRERERDDTKR